MDTLRLLQAMVRAKAHRLNHAHNCAELAYCATVLFDLHALHSLTVAGLAIVVVGALIAGE